MKTATVKLKIVRQIILLNSSMILGIAILLIFVFSLFSSMSGLANAINYSGSERMRTILTGYLGSSYLKETTEGRDGTELAETLLGEIKTYNKILNGLINGDEDLKLVPTDDAEILTLINNWANDWIGYEEALLTIMSPEKSMIKKEMAHDHFSVDNAIALKNTVHKVVQAYTAQSNMKIKSIQIILFAIIGLVLVMGLFIIFYIRNKLIPISLLVSALEKIKGKDLTTRSNFRRDDEIGTISRTLDGMTDAFDHLISDIQKTSQLVEKANEDLSSSQSQSTSSIKDIVESIDTVNISIAQQMNLVEENLGSVDQERKEIQRIAALVQNQSEAVEQSSANIEEMVASINAVNSNTTNARQLGKGLSEMAQDGWSKIESTIQAMEDIRIAAESIQESVSGISDVADTTNLLSMNAAIEAAHAGEAGKGFAVVADEINKLAANSTEEVKRITTLMAQTTNFIQKGTALSSDAGIAFKAILKDIESTVEIILNIAAAMDEQSYGANDILNSINTLVQLTQDIKGITLSEEQNSEKILSSMEELNNLSQKILLASNDQRAGGEELLDSVAVLEDVSQRNKSNVDILNQKIEQFTVSDK